ncbi:MAG TPA: metalloregulator ArsR/SmtB family transcription factor [Steroidobacteraceae bacterium]|jgi:ArsR family transcriptional regulator
MSSDFLSTVSVLRAAAEPTRLRLLALLARAELTVGEICEIVRQSQPRISRHLKLMSEAGLLDRFREHHWVYYRAPSSGDGLETVQRLLTLVDPADETLRQDRKRLEEVIKERGRLASANAAVSTDLSADVDAILLRELCSEPIGALLDVGTGSGHLLELLAANATRAIGIDISSDALRVARTKVHGAGLSRCELQYGDMYDLPFTVPMFDTAVVDRVLAQAERPIAALTEIARTLKDGGRLVVVEDFDALLSAGGTNPIAQIRDWFARAGLQAGGVHPVDTQSGHLLVATARRMVPVTAAA